jgi:integrase
MTELEQVIERSPRLRPRTKSLYLRAVRRFLDYSAGIQSGPMVELWRDHLAQTCKAQTVNSMLAALRYASKRIAQRHQDPSLDFARYAEMLPKEQSQETRALTFEEGAALVFACSGSEPIDLRDRAIVTLGLRTGLRRAAICGLLLSDYDGIDITVTLKGGKRHTITLDNETKAVLRPWLVWLHKHGITDAGALFRSLSRRRVDGTISIGERITPDGLYKAMKRRAETAGIGDFHPHVFRHTFVSWCQQLGIPAYRIAAVTGHSIQTVREPTGVSVQSNSVDHYTHELNPEPLGEKLPSLKVGDDEPED